MGRGEPSHVGERVEGHTKFRNFAFDRVDLCAKYA
jgi:hypothetical protein